MRNSQKQRSYQYRNTGSVLIICLWTLVFFSILSTGLYNIVSSQMNMARALEERSVSRYMAKAASCYAIAERQNAKKPCDTLYGLMTKRTTEMGRGKFVYTFFDEEGKININTAGKEILERLPGLNSTLADAILEYRLKKESHEFDLVEELLFVDGINEGVYDKCKNYVTVYSNSKINMNTAPVEVLFALGFDKQLAENIREYRRGADGEEGTMDDGFFENTDEIPVKLNSFRELSEPQVEELQSVISRDRVSVLTEELLIVIETSILDRPSTKYSVVIIGEKPEGEEAPEGGGGSEGEGKSDAVGQIKIKKWTEY